MTSINGRDFFELVKAIGESKSKQEEDRIIAEEVKYLKNAVPQVSNSKKKTKELVVRAVYVEMLGQDASFAYIKAVELCASTNVLHKRVGYLAASLCLSPEHEFRFMLVNLIQRDINSTNHLEACAALSAVCKIVNVEMIPAIIKDVVKALTHETDVVRRKAVCALHRLYQMDKTCLSDHVERVRRIICDRDPSVMGASLGLLQALICDDPPLYKDLVPSLVSILKQITDHRLPRDFDYHRIPAPWIQMHLLRILAVLGRGDQSASEGMYEVLGEVMRKADTGINVGYAIVFECVQTITSIYPNPTLLDAAATSISRFVRSDSHNLRYMGVKGLAAIVKDYPKYASDHQLAVIDCLEDSDETLKRKTLDLLLRMTSAVNVEFIVEKLLSYLAEGQSDDHFRSDLVSQVTQCAERFAPSTSWYVRTVVRVFELAGDKVKPGVAQTVMQLIAEGTDTGDGDDGEDREGSGEETLRRQTVEDFLVLLDKPKLPPVLAQSITWVIGEYGYLSRTTTKEAVMIKLCDLLQRCTDSSTRAHCITALMKLSAQNGSCPSKVLHLINLYRFSSSLDLHQRCVEFLRLLDHGISTDPEYRGTGGGTGEGCLLADCMPIDASCEDLEVDKNLLFLEGYVTDALANGAKPYSPPEHDRSGSFDYQIPDKGPKIHAGFITTPYERPIPVPSHSSTLGSNGGSIPIGVAINNMPSAGTPFNSGTPLTGGDNAFEKGVTQLLNTRGVAQVWGKKPDPLPLPQSLPQPAPSSARSSPPSIPSTSDVREEKKGATVADVRELTEREKMAQALFGGAKATSTSSTHASKDRRPASVGAVSISPTPLIAENGGTGMSVGVGQRSAPDFMNLNPSPSSSPFLSPSLSSSLTPRTVTTHPNNSNNTVVGSSSSSHVNGDTHRVGESNGILIPLEPTVTHTEDALLQQTSSSARPVLSDSDLNSTLLSFDDISQKIPSLAPALNSTHMPPDPSIQSLNNATLNSTLPRPPPHSQSQSQPVSHSLTPLRIDTQEFGRLWSEPLAGPDGKGLVEEKRAYTCSVRSLEELRTQMPSYLHHVESIQSTMEAIFSSSVGATETEAPGVVLVHVQLQLQQAQSELQLQLEVQPKVPHQYRLEFTVRSPSVRVNSTAFTSISSGLS